MFLGPIGGKPERQRTGGTSHEEKALSLLLTLALCLSLLPTAAWATEDEGGSSLLRRAGRHTLITPSVAIWGAIALILATADILTSRAG